jgi:hypothetical protein
VKFVFDKDWKLARKGQGRHGSPLPRLPGEGPPCRTCPKMPPDLSPLVKAGPHLAVTLSAENRRCYEHYLECEAVGWQGLEDSRDERVRRHAKLILGLRREAERIERSLLERLTVSAIKFASDAADSDGRRKPLRTV